MSQEFDQLKEQAELNRLVFQQRLLSTTETNTNDISDGFDATTGKMRVKSTDENITFVNIITNGAIGIGDEVDLRGNFADSMPTIKHQTTSKKEEQTQSSIITLLRSDQIPLEFISYPIPADFHEIEFWLTGGLFKLKRINTTPSMGFNISTVFPENQYEAYLNNYYGFLGSAFLTNNGNGKYLTSNTRSEVTKTNYDGDSNREYHETIVTINKNKKTSQFKPNIYFNRKQTLYYLGNGIYQSVVEDGIGKILSAVPDFMVIPGAIMRYFSEPLVEVAGVYGIVDNLKPGGDGLDTWYKLTSNVLPEAQNICIHDGIMETLSGTVQIDIDGIFDLEIEEHSYFAPIITDRIHFYREKTISYDVWLPRGISQLSFVSIKEAIRNNVPDNFSYPENTKNNYTYTENLSCETILAAWEKKYITSSLTVTTENKNDFSFSYTNVYPFQETKTIVTHKTEKAETLKLKSYSDSTGEKDLILNNGKFLVLNRSPLNPTTKAPIAFNLDTTSFLIEATSERDINYEISCLGFDITSYIGEKIITSFVIDGKIYIIKGVITSASYLEFDRVFDFTYLGGVSIPYINKSQGKRSEFIITVTSIKKAYSGNQKTYFKNTILPLPYIILDNGCFWNYYLSNKSASLANSPLVGYPFFVDGGSYSKAVFANSIVGYHGNHSYQFPFLVCDQTLQFICTNPLTRPFCRPQYFDNYYPPDNILKTDNLVNNSIYRVNTFEAQTNYEDEIGSYPKQDANFKQISVSQWEIKSNGDIKYKKTFLVPYTLKRPFYNSNDDKCDTRQIISQSHSYYP